jgi:hypothetical protein
VFVASIYAWSGVAKLRPCWLSGETLHALHQAHDFFGWLDATRLTSIGHCRTLAWAIVIVELLLGPLLLVRRTRILGVVIAVGCT